LLLGADQLDKTTQGFLRVFSQIGIRQPEMEFSVQQFLNSFLQDLDSGVSYELHTALDRTLKILSRYVTSDITGIGLRYGDYLRLEAVWPKGSTDLGLQVSTSFGILDRIVSDRSAVIIDEVAGKESCPLLLTNRWKSGSWMGVPLWVGKRVIGVICFFSEQSSAFNRESADRASVVAAHMAPAIETSMALAEASMHLEKLALLNELASAASIGIDADEVATRIIDRLKRIFNTELVAILLLSSDGKTLTEFGDSYLGENPLVIPVDSSLAGYVTETGMPFRA
jgi:transcriptional regulator with GAF, ATPase, and Fis domain